MSRTASPQINGPGGGYRTGAYRETAVPAVLSTVAEVVWSHTPGYGGPGGAAPAGPERQRVLPETGVSLGVVFRRGDDGCVVDPVLEFMGPIRAPRLYVPRPGIHLLGVRLKPEWCRDVFGVHPGEFVDGWAGARELRLPGALDRLGPDARQDDLVRHLLGVVERAWREARRPRSARLAHAALQPLRGFPPPRLDGGAAAREAGVTERHLRRAVAEVCGTGMKAFHRVRRLHHAVSLAGAARPPAWSELALRTGFYDQAHMIREFRALAGVTPVELRAERVAARG